MQEKIHITLSADELRLMMRESVREELQAHQPAVFKPEKSPSVFGRIYFF